MLFEEKKSYNLSKVPKNCVIHTIKFKNFFKEMIWPVSFVQFFNYKLFLLLEIV